MSVKKDSFATWALKLKVYACMRSATPIAVVDFSALPPPPPPPPPCAQESDSSRACVLSGERCGRLSSIYMYFPLFPIIMLREEKLSRDSSTDASSGDALSNLKRRDSGEDPFGSGRFKLFGNMLQRRSRHCF